MSAVLAATTLAKSGEGAKAGPIGLAVILLLCIACYFLFKSMSKHMREVRENFPTDAPATPAGAKADLTKPDLTRAALTRADLTKAETLGAATDPAPPAIEAAGRSVADPAPDDPAR